MELSTKQDWEQAERRLDAWWHRAVLDRPAIIVKAPRSGIAKNAWLSLCDADYVPADQVMSWFTHVDRVTERCQRYVDRTFWGGEAMPVVFPVAIRMVAITAAYLGCPYVIDPVSRTGWADPIIDDWSKRTPIVFDPNNEWWQMSHTLLDAVARYAPGRYYVGIPDLNAPGEIVALLRGAERFAYDLMDNPGPIAPAMQEANLAWYRYWQAAIGAVHQWVGGYFYWMGVWSDRPSADLQCDFNVMISRAMFEEHFLPGIEQQTQWIERTIFHLDGPGAIRHLDALLALPRLTGIQWVPGDGKPPMSKWIPLLRRVQAHGKLLVLFCEPWEVETLLTELEPEGLLLNVTCDSEDEACGLLGKAAAHHPRRVWTLA